MNLLIRLLWTLIRAFWRPKVDFWATATMNFRVLPTDIDINRHMTNSRYLSIMDLGRLDFLIRSGLGKVMWQDKCQAVLGAVNIRFRRALKPFQHYTLNTRLMAIDDRWAYIEQWFECQGELIAYALLKGTFTNKNGRIPHSIVLSKIGQSMPEMALSKALALWNEMDDALKNSKE